MSDSGKAVFLSYAREDATGARRIGEALRAAGLEVWFDENELRGGDVWDAKIRRQIDGCALFVPIISAHTDQRAKGYFRLEWKLAVDQTHLRAEGVPYLAPIVIDETRENDAVVPAEFLRVQWTRLPDALPTPNFVMQVKQLLERRRTSSGREVLPKRPQTGPDREPGRPVEAFVPSRRNHGTVVLVAAYVGIGVALYFGGRTAAPVGTPARVSSGLTPIADVAAPAKTSLNPHRIAVLPLDNYSPDAKDEYLASGMTEELTSSLSKISGLEVIARTSAERAKKSGKTLPEIGADLRVGTVLEGSVRKAGEQLRVTVQLIDVTTQRHLLTQDHNAEFKDLFKTQAEIAERVAAALQIKLLGSDVRRLTTKPTDNAEAYQLYLQGRYHWMKGTEGGAVKARDLFKQALVIDPNYALAYVGLADARDPELPPRLARAEMEAAARKALELDDTLAEAHLANAAIGFAFGWNSAAAEAGARRAIALKPSLALSYDCLGWILSMQGRFDEAIVSVRKAVSLDPTAAGVICDLGVVYYNARKFDQAVEWARKALELDGNLENAHRLIGLVLAVQGRSNDALGFFEKARSLDTTPWNIANIGWAHAASGRRDEARRALAELETLAATRYVTPAARASVHEAIGDRENALRAFEEAFTNGDPECLIFGVEPSWDSIRTDPRFQALVRKIGVYR